MVVTIMAFWPEFLRTIDSGGKIRLWFVFVERIPFDAGEKFTVGRPFGYRDPRPFFTCAPPRLQVSDRRRIKWVRLVRTSLPLPYIKNVSLQDLPRSLHRRRNGPNVLFDEGGH